MGTMLIISSTPRITYKIGMRAGVVAAEGKSLPWLNSAEPSIEVAAGFTGIYRILMWPKLLQAKTVAFCHYRSVIRS